MRCNQHGRPDPNGDFELIDGRIVMRDGARLGVNLLSMRDSDNRGLSVFLQDSSSGSPMIDARAFVDAVGAVRYGGYAPLPPVRPAADHPEVAAIKARDAAMAAEMQRRSQGYAPLRAVADAANACRYIR